MKKVMFFCLVFFVLPLSVYAANCSNREPITGTCTCNGASVSSGYCCYYNPSAGNITYQATQTCGYTAWSPHYQSAKYGITLNIVRGGLTETDRQLLVNYSDIVSPGQENRLSAAYIQSKNPNFINTNYMLLASIIYSPADADSTAIYQNAQAYAAANGCNFEDFFYHFSTNANYVSDSQAISVDGWPNGNATSRAASRVIKYGWGSYRWVWNFQNACTKNFLAQEFYNQLHAVSPELGGTFIDEASPNPPFTIGPSSGSGIVAEYGKNVSQMVYEYFYDIADAFNVVKQKNPGKIFIANIGKYDSGIQANRTKIMLNGADGIYTEFYGFVGDVPDSNFELFYNNSLRQKQTHFVVAGDWGESSVNQGMYASKEERIKMTQTAWYYLIRDRENKYVYMVGYGHKTLNPTDSALQYYSLLFNVGEPTLNIPSGKSPVSGPAGNEGVYIFQSGVDPLNKDYRILARDFENALVLMRFLAPSEGGSKSNGDNSSLAITLPGTYYLLRQDGSVDSTPRTTLTIRNAEGAVLVKSSCSSACNFVDADCNNKIDGSELNSAITRWYADQFVISQLMSIIRQWKAGTC